MLPENLHTEQIKRFHASIAKLNTAIDAEPDGSIKKGELCREWYNLSKLWQKIDDFIESTVKSELDKTLYINE